MVIHPRDRDLVVGTHGRSIYVMDIEPIQKLTPKIRNKPVHVFELPWTADHNRWDRKPSALVRKSERDPLSIQYFSARGGTAQITVKTENGRLVHELEHPSRRGINVAQWDLVVDRNAELKWQLGEAQKNLEEAKSKLDKAADPNTADTGEQNDESQEGGEKLAKLVKAEVEASDKVESIQRVIDEAKKYTDQPEGTRERMVRQIYLCKGEYTIEVKLRKKTDAQKLIVGSDRKTPDKLDTEKKRKAETLRLLEEYDISK